MNMENIMKMIYDLSINNIFLNIDSIDRMLAILIDEKDLNEYILNISVQQIRSNNLASYSSYTKKIVIYSNMIDKMINNISRSLKTNNHLTKNIYINLSILQVVLHEIEHANQEKIISYNNLEAFILRISQMISPEKEIYEISPKERLAEIKSYGDILKILGYYINDDDSVSELIKNEEMIRKLRGYHYTDNQLYSPFVSFLILGDKKHLLSSFEWYSEKNTTMLENINKLYNLNECLFYGFPISNENYKNMMIQILATLNRNYNDKIKIK